MIYRNLAKVSLLALTLVALVTSGKSYAQNINDCQWYTSAGSGTTYYTPVNNYWKYSYSQMIFLPSEIGYQAGEAGTIYKIGFQYGYSTAMSSKTNVKIYMKNITNSTFADGSSWITTGLTQVYSGNLNCSGNGTWNDFTLSTPFNYTGGNLLVVVDDNSNGYDGSSYIFKSFTTDGVRVISYSSDGTYSSHTVSGTNQITNQTGSTYTYRCNTRFCISENCSTHRSGNFAFSPATANYNYVIGSGDFAEPSLVNNLSPAGTVTYSSSNTAVATVNSTTGAVTFTGIEGNVTITACSESGSYCKEYASYTINVNDGCLVIGTGTSTTYSTPLSTGWKNSYDQMIFTAAEVGAGIIHSIGFNAVGANSTPRQVDIYMGEVDRATFASSTDWVPVSQLEHVYTGTWNIVAGWNMFPVDYLYTGIGNLVIAVDCGASTYTSSAFYYTETTGTTTIYAYSDTYDAVPATINSYQGSSSSLSYRPNTKICIDPCSVRPTFEFENTMAMCYLGNNCPMLPLDNTSTGVLSFTSSDESVATVDNMGNITTYTMGETTIEAMVQMDGETCPAKASYVLQVICPALIPSAQSVSLCEGGQVTLTASTPGGGVLQWFDAVDATTPVATGETYTTNAQHSTTYYVATYNADYDCYSSRVPSYVNIFDFGYATSTQNISGYVGATMYGYPPEGTTPGATYTASGMPAWMTLNSSDGSFSGTPTAAGSGTFTITASNGTCSASVTVHWTVVANNLTCCDPSAFYIFKQGEPRPIQMEADGYYYINVCKDESATFRVQPIANCTGYTYNWRLASSTGGLLTEGSGTTFTYTYDRAMGYNMTLTIRKGSQCSVAIPIRIRVAGAFQVATRPSFDLCKGEPFNIYVSSDGIGSVDVVRPNGGSASTLGQTDTILLPDGEPCPGIGCFYRSSVTFADFAADATIRDANDLLYILLNIEHSWIGDIYIAITCPDNQRSVILSQSGSGSTTCHDSIPSGYSSWDASGTNASTGSYFGLPDHADAAGSSACDPTNSSNQPGTGWNYIWSENTSNGYTYAGGVNSLIYESVNVGNDASGSVDSSHFSDMSQIYHPQETFDNLIGCHLNGTWSIEVVDGWGSDNGYIFHWEMGLNPELLPDSWDYTVDIDSAWVDCGWPSTKAGVYMEITPPNDFVGTTGCDLFLRDEYGCISEYNNIVTVTMYDSEGSTTHVGPQCEPYYWNISGVTYDTSGTYVEQGLTAHGCPNRDTLILVVSGAKYDTVTAQGCQSYDWRGHTYTSSGSYNDTLTSSMGCDSITTLILEILPELTTQKDTAVCPITFPFDFYNSHFTEAGTQTQNLQTTDGCDSIVTLTVTTLSKPEVTLNTIADNCPIPTTSNYTVTPTVTGGTSPFTYAWTGDYTGTDQNATIPGTNTCGDFSVEVIVTDQNGCMDTANTSWHAVDTELPHIDNLTETPALLTNNNCEYKVPDLLTMLNISDNCQVKTQTQDPPANDIITAETDVIVTVEDLCGNVATQTVHLTIPDPLTADIDNTNVACNGGHDGTVTLSNIQGGTSPYTFSWNTGATTQNLTGQTAGDYSVTISDANGCTLVKNATISESGDLVSTLTPTPVTCYQTATGSIVIDSVVGGTQPYASFQWSNGSTSSTGIDNLMPGEYSLTITDNQGCSLTISATVADRAQLTIEENTAAHQNIDCNGNSTGQLGATAHGGTGSYTYTLNGTDNTTGIFTGLPAGPYTVTVTDSLTCTNTVDITLDEPDPIQITNISTIADDCPIPTSSNYTVTTTVTGGTEPYTYTWTGSYTGTDATATVPGTNTCGDFSVEVIVTDQHGCMDTANTTWHAVDTELPHIDNLTETPALLTYNNCEYKVPDLLTMLNISDNCQIKTQTQDPPANDIITAETDVIVTVEDLCGNVATQTVHLTIPDPLSADIANTNVACNGGHDGTVTLSNIQGGTTPYTFSWNTGATTQNLTGQTAGDYSVTISDANGCTLVKTATINESGDLVSTLTPTPVTCYQTATGSIVIDSVVGGTQPYASFQWSNGSTSSTGIDNLMPGEYSLTITDNQGCSLTISATVADRAQLTIEENTAAHQNIDCNGNSTGQLGATAHGGTGAYTYTLNGTDNNTGIFTGLAAGPYTVTVTDSLTCTNTVDITLTEPNPLQVGHSSTPANCFGEHNGSLTVTASHGTAPFTYTLEATGESNNTGIFAGLAAATYTINIVDANGCPISDNVTVDEPTELRMSEVAASHVNIACSGEATGQFKVEAFQGSPTYTYTMGTTTNSTGLFTGLHAGSYPVTVSDSHGCTHDTTIVITELSPIYIQETAHQDVNCNGENNGSFTVEASGGAEGFSYVINGGVAQSTGTVPNATAGTYYITATDANGCFIKDTVIITQPTLLTINENTNAHQNVLCFGTNTASVTVYGSGGTSPYTYYLDAQQNTTGVFASQIMGDYTAHVVDNHGCEATMPISITEPTALKLGIVGTNLRCKLDGTGAIDLSVSGGTPAYTYHWSNNATTQDLQNLQAGTYSVTVTDNNNCTHDTSIVITEPEGMILTMSPDQTICNHESVDIWATVQQGTRPYRFRWNNGSTDSAQTVTPSATTTYQFQVTDQNDCSLTDNVTITVNYQSTGIDEQNECDTYTWPTNGATYTESTNAPQVTGLTNAAGCDSTAILHLTIRYSTEGTDIQTGCDVFRWGHNGQSYTASTTEPQVTIHNANRAGCDSTIHLDLTVNYSTTVHDTTAHICENAEPFIWNGMAYHQSGTFSALLHTYLGCDSTVTMTLLVHDTNHSYVYDTCFVKELPWSYNGREYPTPVFDDLFTLENRWGCDSIVHYNLEAIFDCSEFLQFPSVVTPNGDGINDIFQVVGLLEQECYPLNKLTIYNRWGAKIYEVNNIDEVEDFWDPEKERTPAGTYYYRFDGDGFRGHVERKGVIEVVR